MQSINSEKVSSIESNKYDIFKKRDMSDEESDELNNRTTEKISRKSIFSSIPKDALLVPNLELRKSHTEWRWRIFDIPNMKSQLVEVSYKKPNENIMYADKNGNWKEACVDKSFDNFVIMEFFSYTKL